ncbi:MAG TPA: DUF899 family protein [Steroidobacteraceae bacterium]|nr:DUF899 family protein [Steroidobacteraceae bacterium]
MKYEAATERMAAYRKQIGETRRKIREIQAQIEPQTVSDYEFRTMTGSVKLSQLFGSHRDLMVVHSMGKACPGCTLWADGYNGIHRHVVTRAAFVVSSPDAPDVQQEFAASRGWVFPMVSHMGTSFAADMGYRSPSGGWRPGMSVFRLEGERILRVSDVEWGPGDDFCTLWHLFDLLPEGPAGWSPKIQYS